MNAFEASRAVVDAGLKVHRALGPGLLESAYEQCLEHELQLRGLAVQRRVPLAILYKQLRIEGAYRLDLVVADEVIVEIKTVDTLNRLHESQMLTYLKFSKWKVGLLINFNVSLFKNGIRRLVL